MENQRLIELENGFNFRELGGYPTLDGATTKWHKLIRAAHMSDLNTRELAFLYDYGIRTVIDFRSSSEVATYPDHLSSFFRYIRIPVFDNDITESNASVDEIRKYFASSPKAGFDRMMRVYRQLVISEQSHRAYQDFFRALICGGSIGGVLFHCSAGKDRTGMGAILLLNALNVPEKQIFQDYLMTNRYSTKRVQERLDYAKKVRMNECYLQSIWDLSTVNKFYYDQIVALVNYQYGGFNTYLKDVIGVEPLVISQLKELYLS
ncbi:tyrosine-protein phosphatase [Lactobacillus sp. 3B(2020)]|uniref:tyrosine-protein phosphatase n=1 Tax=Lactobacillus sp. 3B(2020) TaxID=2695882 RepID=UPI0015DEE548|nr:tyrosine-protein phosphatase [Lactobacillus sp. 3B(2020)]QLL69160.1 protein-tyrosine-phosphatase [Lactobacillus sp. 3B(2020)]